MIREEKQTKNAMNSLFFKVMEEFHVIIHPGMQVECKLTFFILLFGVNSTELL